MNYLHQGASKIWYIIPDCNREKFEWAAHEKLGELFKKDKNFLLDINTMISPAYLMKHGVSFY